MLRRSNEKETKKRYLFLIEITLAWCSLNESPVVGALVRAIGNGLTRKGRLKAMTSR